MIYGFDWTGHQQGLTSEVHLFTSIFARSYGAGLRLRCPLLSSNYLLLLLLTVPNNICYWAQLSSVHPPTLQPAPLRPGLYWRETACELLATKIYLITKKIDSSGQDSSSGVMRELSQNINMCVNIFVTQNILTCEAKFFSFLKNLS